MEGFIFTPEQKYTKQIYRLLSYLLFLLEKDDHNDARNLLNNLVNPPFDDFEDLMNKVQKDVKGWFNVGIISDKAVNFDSKDFHKNDSPRIQKVNKMKMVEPNSVLRSLRPQERAQQSSKDRNGTGFKSEDGKKPIAFQEDTSGCSGIWDISKDYTDRESSGKLSTDSKPSNTKLGSTLSPKSDVLKSGTTKVRASPRIEQHVKTSDESLHIKKRTRVLPEVEISYTEDLLLWAEPKEGPHSFQPPMFQKNIESKSDDQDSSNDFVKDKEPNIKTVKASDLAKTGERGLVNKKLQTGHASEAQVTKYTGSSLASKEGARIAVESSTAVKNRSRKGDICESKPHVSTRNPKPNDKKKVQTRVVGSKNKSRKDFT
ncbi:hypothetical protein RF11_09544 [Thelohanellus kitauei]|uniref:Uncharacterized protein n=1 Tax=Thelohanellus kitauei TaxID=669202 RepID=A0A0C2ITE8_THEKT|nr:hypothetical protein RF11_09544 [Thelohanellus kitauei]